MRKKNVLSLLLALVLLFGAGPVARAANSTELIWENSGQAGKIYLDLLALDISAYGIQLELTLNGSYPDCVFRADNQSAYSPDCTVEVRQQQTEIIIYLTDTEPLNDRADFALGTLDLGTKTAVKNSVLPEYARITVLDRNLTGSSTRISVTGTGRTDSTDKNTPTQTTPNVRPDKPDTGTDGGGTVLPDTSPAILIFSDVQETDWFYDAVRFVYERGMMTGTSETTFAPGTTTTRGMVVTILHRLEGSPAAAPSAFTDVPAGQYYAAAVAWASANGIVTGYSDSIFQPNTPITREQMAAILYRYAQYKNMDVSRRNALTQFSDRAAVSSYAADAMAWAVDAGLITGIDGRLEPAGNASRAQVATILMRLCENVLV